MKKSEKLSKKKPFDLQSSKIRTQLSRPSNINMKKDLDQNYLGIFAPDEQHNIYNQNIFQSPSNNQSQSQSSFELDSNQIEPKEDEKQTIEKVLHRLGLSKKQTRVSKNQELEVVVNNIVQNCIGTINREENIEEYEKIYGNQFKQKLNEMESHVSIHVSELTQLEKINKLSSRGLIGVYKYIRLFLKRISLLCQAIVEHSLFESIILIIIILNSIKMAFDDPLAGQSSTAIENIFIVLYTIEMFLKIFAFGFLFNEKAYLRDPWNLMDFVIVGTSIMPLVVNIQFSVNSLRAIRVLRPLKTITKVKALKMIVSTLFYSFSLVMDSLYILIFVMVVFSIAGTQLFSGLLKNRCMQLATGTLTDQLCTKGGSTCGLGFECVKGIQNPNFSINNFDTFLWSMLSVFRSLTLEGWSDIMIGLQNVYSPFSFIYSVLIVFLCEYVLLNMTMAILKYKYSQVKGNTIEQQQEEKTEYQPQFLKKLGIYNEISKLSSQPPLARYKCQDKIYVGSEQFKKDQIKPQQLPTDNQLVNYFSSKKVTMDKITHKKINKVDLEELKNIGRYKMERIQENVYFQTVDLYQNENKMSSARSIKSEKSDSNKDNSYDSDYSSYRQSYDSDSSSNISMNQAQFHNQKAFEVRQKLGQSSKKIQRNTIGSSKSILKQIQNPKKLKVNNEINELQWMLKLVGDVPGAESSYDRDNQIYLPQIDLNELHVERLYERFNDLGEYKLKRIEKKNQLDYFQISHKNKVFVKKEERKKNLTLQEINEQNSLDIKQLQLVNELTKKQLKCRIKPKQMLNQHRSYDITRVIISQKIKDAEKKKEELNENMSNLNFVVHYKVNLSEVGKKQQNNNESIFERVINSEKKGLKIPEMIKEKTLDKRTKSKKPQSSQAETNHYLKLLQKHQIQQKIELEQQRIMQIFFKKQKRTNKKKQQERSFKQQYHAIKQDDIFNRHGSITLAPPNQNYIDQQVYDQINIKPEEYDIYMKGILGVFTVIRKKTLLFISKGFYDNLMLLLVIANTVTLSLNGMIDTDSPQFIQVNTVFTYAFAIDLILKIFAFGSQFFGDIMNLFDGFVVSISIVELTFGSEGSNLSALRAVRILRAFRVLRITRLIRTLNYMKIVMSVVSSVITQFVYIFMLLALFIFIYTLLGMQIFGGKLLPHSITGIRQDFDNFFNAVFSVFQVLTVENWNDIETLILTSQNGVYSVFYLISWIFIGNWILLNLLQAILLDGFDKDAAVDTEQQDIPIQEKKIQSQKQNSVNSYDEQDQEKQYSSEDASLFIFLPSSYIRVIAIKISTSKIFQNFIIIMIILSSIKLVIDTYLEEDGEFSYITDQIDLAFNVVFIIQCGLKIISQGLILGQNAYLKSSWSKLDFFIVATAVVDMSLGIDLSILKLFRTLRPLRIISRNPDMRIIIASLGESMLGIFNVIIIILCIFLMFGILGINLLQNKLNFCNQSPQLTHGYYGPYGVNQTACQADGGVWTTHFINFDNILNSLLSLGPDKDANHMYFMIFAVIIIFICSYFFMDLLVGVLFMNFHEAESKIRPKTLTDKQINWKNLQKIIVEEDPCFELYLEPQNQIRRFFYHIVTFKAFQIFVTACILGNILVMMISEDDQSALRTSILERINFVFSIVFIVELVLKLLAFSKGYFLSGWNIFDFFVVMASVLDIILDFTGVKTQGSQALSILPQIARIFRVLRVTRLLRMFKRFKGLQKLIQTFIFSFPALAKGLSIVCLFLFISSVLASYLFGSIKSDYAGNFSQQRNFHNFHSSLQLLFIITTGQNWYFYMFESMQPGYVVCMTDQPCTQAYYIIFWLLYVFFSQKVFMQLFVLIVLDQFEANYINQNNPLGIFSLFQEDFRIKWIEITAKYHSEKIQSKRLIQLLLVLKQPLGSGKNELLSNYEGQLKENQKLSQDQIKLKISQYDLKLKKTAAKQIHKMNIIKNRMYLGYHETFYHFAKFSMTSDMMEAANPFQKQAIEQMNKESEEKLQKLKPEGNLFYFQEQQNKNGLKETLNPIEMILFTQMIIKSWHNYSLKYHKENTDEKEKSYDDLAYDSLNNSCASDIEEAAYEKLPMEKKFAQRKGLMQKGGDEKAYEYKVMPNIDEHYRNERKKNGKKTRINFGQGARQSQKSSQKPSKKISSRLSSRYRLSKRQSSKQSKKI